MPSIRPTLGIVIPTLNEEEHLPTLLRGLEHIRLPLEVVVLDGGSTDGTVALALAAGVTVVESPRGRARQMNAGAACLSSDWLLFLHADSRLPEGSALALERWLGEAAPRDVGTFAFALDGTNPLWRIIEAGQWVRERLLGLAYGDQGLLVHRALFLEVGGFPEVPILEDVELLRHLRRRGRWRRISAPLLTNPRRFEREGVLKAWLRNAAIVLLYRAGVSPGRLAPLYPPEAGPPLPSLLLFAREPVPGRVKTRLAEGIGEVEAARVYANVARVVADQVRGGPYRTVVYFDPPGARKVVRKWLGSEDLHFTPQEGDDLGERLVCAIEKELGESPAVVVVGTDAPGVDRALVTEALERLGGAEVVLGPAEDGGYYLIGMKAPHPELFRGIPWSTGGVLTATLARARGLGLRTSLLRTLPDVDTVQDWERLGPTLGWGEGGQRGPS